MSEIKTINKCQITGCEAQAKGRFHSGTLLCGRHYKQKQRFGVIINIAPGPKGFHEQPKNKLRKISKAGGIMAQRKGTGHKWNSEEAKLARQKSQ